MIDLIFYAGCEIVVIRISGSFTFFSNSSSGLNSFVPIENVYMNKEGILKEHPDLKGLSYTEMKKESINRLKKKVKELGSEDKIKDYVISEMTSQGMKLKSVSKVDNKKEDVFLR